MPFDFRFRYLEDEKELRQLKRFLLEQTLNYPNYEDWVERAIAEIDLGYKRTILAFSDDFLIGDAIFQPHKTLSKVMEFKNMRIHQKYWNRYFGYFMTRQVEAESRLGGFEAVMGDIRSDRLDVLNLMKSCGYMEVVRAPRYEPNVEDVILWKDLKMAA